MRHNIDELDSFSGVAYGQKASLILAVGMICHEIPLYMTNVDNDQVDQILLKLNGDEIIVDLTGEEVRNFMSKNRGKTLRDGEFVIRLSDFTMNTQEGQELRELVTLPDDNFTLEIKLAAVTAQQTTDGDVPAIAGEMVTSSRVLSNGSLKPRLTIPKFFTDILPMGKTGKNKYTKYQKGPRIFAMHLLSTAVTSLEIKHNGLTRFNQLVTRMHNRLTDEGFTLITGYTSFIPVLLGWGKSDMLQTAGTSFEINCTTTAATDIPVLFETLEAA